MISSIHHVALTVKDLQESVEWYKSKLGFTEVKSYQDEEMDITLLQLGTIKLELFNFKDKTQELPEYRKEFMSDLRTSGTKHVCFQTDDLESTLKDLQSKGVEIVGKPSEPFFGGKYVFIKDCNGIFIELYENLHKSY